MNYLYLLCISSDCKLLVPALLVVFKPCFPQEHSVLGLFAFLRHFTSKSAHMAYKPQFKHLFLGLICSNLAVNCFNRKTHRHITSTQQMGVVGLPTSKINTRGHKVPPGIWTSKKSCMDRVKDRMHNVFTIFLTVLVPRFIAITISVIVIMLTRFPYRCPNR